MADNANQDLQKLKDSITAWRDSKQTAILNQADFLAGLPDGMSLVSSYTIVQVTEQAKDILASLQAQVAEATTSED